MVVRRQPEFVIFFYQDELEHDLETSGSILSNIDASRERPFLDFNLFPPNLGKYAEGNVSEVFSGLRF